MRFLLLTVLCCYTVFAGAQTQDSARRTAIPKDRRWAITFSPLAMMQIDYTFLTGAEYHLSDKVKLVADAGYIFSSSYMDRGDPMRQATGFIFRPGVKFFPSPAGDFYLHPQLFYKHVTHHLYDWLDKDVVNGVGTYQQLQDFRYRRTAIGVNFLFGAMRELGKSGRLMADLYLGVGFRRKSFGLVGEKNSRYNNTGFFVLGRGGEESLLPSLPMGVRFVYEL